jgi:hypothetical protein
MHLRGKNYVILSLQKLQPRHEIQGIDENFPMSSEISSLKGSWSIVMRSRAVLLKKLKTCYRIQGIDENITHIFRNSP